MKECEQVKKLHDDLIKSATFPFPQKKARINASNKHGVYVIYSPENDILHIGTTKRGKNGLNQRLKNHMSGQSSFTKKYCKPKGIDLRNGYRFKYIEVEDGRKRAFLEALTIGLLCPAHIGTGEKKKI